ncbi:MAG: hypothetical protein ACOH2M_05280 [Cypionkella sp.]
MLTLNNLLDKCKETCAVSSDNALAGRLKVSRQRVSAWRHGENYPDAVACARIAELTGEPLARVIGIVGEARALSMAEKAVWHRLAAAAAVAGVALLSLYTLDAGQAVDFAIMPLMSIMSALAFTFLNVQNPRSPRTIKDLQHAWMLAL